MGNPSTADADEPPAGRSGALSYIHLCAYPHPVGYGMYIPIYPNIIPSASGGDWAGWDEGGVY